MTRGVEARNGTLNHEVLPPPVEVRIVDPSEFGKYAEPIANIWNQPSVISHLSGIAPRETPVDIDVRTYAKNNPDFNILVAIPPEIEKFYRERSDYIRLLVAQDMEGEVVGTVTVERQSGLGLIYATISRLAVDENKRGRDVARKLVRAAEALIFPTREKGGLGSTHVRAGVVTDIPGAFKPSNLFQKEGYSFLEHIFDSCVSWDPKKNRFDKRDVTVFTKTSDQFRRQNIGTTPTEIPRLTTATN